jgi:methylenetetrahydrofolate dehydrogenase (NADP+)/methenyltetrahydrofolate cyclohydrolase/formyltetrahydrofolate synthetase
MCFRTDTEAELELLKQASLESGAFRAVISKHWAEGGAGATGLADAVIEACKEPSEFRCHVLTVSVMRLIQSEIQEAYRTYLFGASYCCIQSCQDTWFSVLCSVSL